MTNPADAQRGKRCQRPEHRRQLRQLQARLEASRQHVQLLLTREREAWRRMLQAESELQNMKHWRFTFYCRWFGHAFSPKGHYGPNNCKRCGVHREWARTHPVACPVEKE